MIAHVNNQMATAYEPVSVSGIFEFFEGMIDWMKRIYKNLFYCSIFECGSIPVIALKNLLDTGKICAHIIKTSAGMCMQI
jgi:hypothetical protein